MNLHDYARGNAVTKHDPMGLQAPISIYPILPLPPTKLPPIATTPDEATVLAMCSTIASSRARSCCGCTLGDCHNAIRDIFRAKDRAWTIPVGPQQCERWAKDCLSRLPDIESNRCVAFAYIFIEDRDFGGGHFGNPITGDRPTHAYAKIVFCNSHALYIDNGARGGNDHIVIF